MFCIEIKPNKKYVFDKLERAISCFMYVPEHCMKFVKFNKKFCKLLIGSFKFHSKMNKN